MPRPIHRLFLPLALAAALGLAACGSSSNDSSSSAASDSTTAATTTPAAGTGYGAGGGSSSKGATLNLTADKGGQLAFDTTTLSAKAGKVTLDLANPSPVPHAIAIEGNGVDQDGQTVSTGGHSTVTVDLKPGTYTFYCPVPGHEAGGMKGTLTVE